MMVVLFLSLLTISFLIIGCGGKYSDAKKMNEEFIALVEDYIADLDKADNAKGAAKAINRFADGMEDLWPRMQKLSEKYPELKDKSNPPEEKMAGAMIKLMAYIKDPEVQKAQKRLGAVMTQK